MKSKIEILAPGGDIDSIKAAILAGANAVYCGLDRFNARNTATNISFDDLQGVLRLAHSHDCQVFLTLNILIVESEIPALIALLNKLINTTLDGIIVQDLGVFYLLNQYFKTLKIHASTQLTTHNQGQVSFLSKLNAARVNLSRELNLGEIKALTAVAHQNDVLTEVFVHGSNCISFSGICYMSSVQSGNSGNRGRCSQPCRDRYITTDAGKDFPLNLKDNSAFLDVRELAEAGVDSFKIEGRIKQFDYVYTVVNAWKKQLQRFYTGNKLSSDNSELYKVFNRDLSDSFLKGKLHKDIFIDQPRNHSMLYLSEINNNTENDDIEKVQLALYDENEKLKSFVEKRIKSLSIDKIPIIISISGEIGNPLKVIVKTADSSFVIFSSMNLTFSKITILNYDIVFKRLKVINETEYVISYLELDQLQPSASLPFNELTSIKKRILFKLNGSKEWMDPIDVPVLKKQIALKTQPELLIFIDSQKDVALCNETDVTICFLLPDGFKKEATAMTALFIANKKLIPCFPSVLIGDDYTAAVEFLQQLQPGLIVTNNTGIAYEAWERGISWIAGPFLNIVNSFSIKCLKEYFNCSGAFISNELNKMQLQRIQKPEDFKLYYSIFHPVVLMTSRQCLFHQVTGCEKECMDDECLQYCEKSAFIQNLEKQTTFNLEKTIGNYHTIIQDMHFMNTAILKDLPDLFSGFSINLSDIKTKTNLEKDKTVIIQLFNNLVNHKTDAVKNLNATIHPTTNRQYIKGI